MKTRLRAWLFVAMAGFAVANTGCVGSSSEKIAADKERLKRYILSEAPKNIPNELNTNFDDKVTLLGYRVSPSGAVKSGQQVKITMYWRADKQVDKGWNLFTHVLDGSGERVLNIDNVGPLREWRGSRQALPPFAWDTGKVYVDEQSFTVPTDVKTSKIQVVTGIWRGPDRLKVLKGPHDSQNRAIVADIKLKNSASRRRNTRVPTLRVNKLAKEQSIKIDGKLDEAAWKTAAATGPFRNVQTGEANRDFPVNGSAKVLWDDKGIYVAFDVRDPNIVGGFEKGAKDPQLWTKDTVEIMIDPDGDGDNKDYYEIQINPQNLVFDSAFDRYNQPKKEPDGPFGHQEWSSQLKSAVSVDGTLDNAKDKDRGYVVEAFLPWKAFSKAEKAPPELGDTWRVNFYAMENNGGVAWSPILKQGNFHKASRFGRILWAEKDWKPAGIARLKQARNRAKAKVRATEAQKKAVPAKSAAKTPEPKHAESKRPEPKQ